MRTIIDLPKGQMEALDRVTQRERISRAEAVRRAVTDYLRKWSAPMGHGHGAFGLWKGRKLDARKYEDTLRKEWTTHARRP
jgi:hypothetical protein